MSLFRNMLAQMEEAGNLLELTADAKVILENPERILFVSIPVRMDSGEIQVFEGYRVQHSTIRGPAKGGVRYSKDLNLEEVKALAAWMSIKTSVVNIPLGGGKGGVKVDTSHLSDAELERLTRGYVQAIAPIIGPRKDVPAPDMYTNQRIMGWMADEFSRLQGETTFGVVTGKPLEIGGSVGRDAATAQGGIYILERYLEKVGREVQTAVVQGFGNVGGHMARLLHEKGIRVLAVSDVGGGVFSEKGIDIPGAYCALKEHGTVSKMAGGKQISNEELLSLSCDLLVLAALENQVRSDNVDAVCAQMIMELANGPITPEADKILAKRRIPVIPDILANAGGVTVSYFELVQNESNLYWSLNKVHRRLKIIMNNALDEVLENQRLCEESSEKLKKKIASGEGYPVTLRQSAFVTALKRIERAMKFRGRI
ncbi:Glu/Leu/Phe/Val dehydrogenase [Candidatus Peregrinibacteria bacterium]|nr:MAG: Glu/Leu/Phe/Val dehydrogenase [Candidatus Peregrinibacteria bacterium]